MRDDLRASAYVRPLSIALLRCYGICAKWPDAISADRAQAPIPRRKSGRSHKSWKQNVCRVPRDSRNHRAYLLSDARCALRLGGLVERKKRR